MEPVEKTNKVLLEVPVVGIDEQSMVQEIEDKPNNLIEPEEIEEPKLENNEESQDKLIEIDVCDEQVTDLQSAYSNFRKRSQKRKGTLQRTKSKSKIRTLPRNLKDFKEKLRAKFVKQILSYEGTPYKKKFHEPGTPLYDSPIFLDCCGLVRRVMWDLKADFGFRIGGGHQSYQFDTLPIILTEEEMKPGDIIFYSATYYPFKNLPQKVHDMVHVEVYMGEGKSFGARKKKGVCKMYDKYVTKAKSYFDISIHFRSLDTWLEGICT